MVADPAFQRDVQNPAGKQGSFDGVGGLSRADEILNSQYQRVEEARARGSGQIGQGRDDRLAAS